jgi:hypothetical protein
MQEIEINGKLQKLSKDSFKLNLNLQELYEPCRVCPGG